MKERRKRSGQTSGDGRNEGTRKEGGIRCRAGVVSFDMDVAVEAAREVKRQF